jgi:AcrR family transcriptional regulator
MDEVKPRRRAAGMTPEERREMIVRAALPLVAEFGAAVTTQRVARAAGIGEATIFRVFPDKNALLDACLVEALRPDRMLDRLMAVPLGRPLAERLIEAAEVLREHLDGVAAVMGALRASRYRARDTGGEDAPAPRRRPAPDSSRDAGALATRAAVARLFEPEAPSLRLPPERLAELFLAIIFPGGRPHAGAGSPVAVGDLVDVFLSGAFNRSGDRG